MAVAFLPLVLVATFFVGAFAGLALLAAGFLAGLAFFFGLLFFGLLAAADLLAPALVAFFLAGDLVVFLTPKDIQSDVRPKERASRPASAYTKRIK